MGKAGSPGRGQKARLRTGTGCEKVSSAGTAAHTVMGHMLKLEAASGRGGFSELHSPNPFLIITGAVLKL